MAVEGAEVDMRYNPRTIEYSRIAGWLIRTALGLLVTGMTAMFGVAVFMPEMFLRLFEALRLIAALTTVILLPWALVDYRSQYNAMLFYIKTRAGHGALVAHLSVDYSKTAKQARDKVKVAFAVIAFLVVYLGVLYGVYDLSHPPIEAAGSQ